MRITHTWDDLKAALERRRDALAAEIGGYPPPITACDAQFNHLLEQRRLVSGELTRLARAADSGMAVDEFLAAAPAAAEALYARM